MDELTARLEALFRYYAADHDPHESFAALGRLVAEFRREVRLLIAEYGQTAVDKALEEMPDAARPSVSLH